MDLNAVVTLALTFFLVALLTTGLWIRSALRLRTLRRRFAPVLDVEKEGEKLAIERDQLAATVHSTRQRWEKEFTETIAELEQLTQQVTLLRDEADLQSFGIYEPKYGFEDSNRYKKKLDDIRAAQKEMVKEKTAAVCNTTWQVSGSAAKGRKMIDRLSRLQLRAFNGECDAAIAKVTYSNVMNMERRIEKAWEAINKLGETNDCQLTRQYLGYKLQELYLVHEHREKIYEEREEQRRIREQMREEERAQKEIERAQQEAEREEERYEKALARAQAEMAKATAAQQAKLEEKVAALQEKLAEAHANKERAMSRAQMTKSGHVYVISNIGSFGQDVYKIGMTRRLEPLDRVKELGDASVPFGFDVHAMIFSENAPELENQLHKAFDERRVNLVNNRKEFFAVRLPEIADRIRERHAHVEFTLAAEAQEYRKTLAMSRKRAQEKNQAEGPPTPPSLENAKARYEQRKKMWAPVA